VCIEELGLLDGKLEW